MNHPKIAYSDREVYETAVRLGSQTATAHELGISQTTVSRCVRRHAAAINGVIPRAAPWGTGRLDTRACFTRLEERVDELACSVVQLIGMVETLLARPAAPSRVVEFRPDHRRVVDGGRRVREQRRDARQAIA